MIRTRVCIMILMGYLKLEMVYFLIKFLSKEENYETRGEEHQNTDTDMMKITALEQQRRAEHIKTVCHDWEDKKAGGSPGPAWLEDRSGRSHLAFGNEVWRSSLSQFDQELQISSHLLHRGPPNISYCWIHKGRLSSFSNTQIAPDLLKPFQ